MIRNPVSRAGLISGSLAFGGFFSFLAVAPNLRADWTSAPLSLAATVALFAAGYAIGAALSRIALNYIDELSVLVVSLASMVVIGVATGTIVLASASIEALVGFVFVYAVAAGAAMPNATLLAMRPSVDLAPLALALLGMSKMALAALTTSLLTLSFASAGAYMSLVMSVAALGALIAVIPVRRIAVP